MVSDHLDLAARCLVHADKADDAGLYTTANVLWLASQALKERQAMTPAEVRAARAYMNLTQTELAALLRMGSDGRRTIRAWETEGGKWNISGPASVAIEALLTGWRPST